ncbi:hypothetical protein [Cylindrospermum sp. FACHB-282]|nr:hypothetical protein [Cylindrospermum sp. FACHB-282]
MMISNQTITSDLLVELSTEQQELLTGGRNGWPGGGHGGGWW